MCIPFCLPRVGTGPSEVKTEHLCTFVAATEQGSSEHGICKYRVVQGMMSEHVIIGSKSVYHGWICNVPHTTLSGVLDCPLGLCREIPQCQAHILDSIASFYCEVVREAVCTAKRGQLLDSCALGEQYGDGAYMNKGPCLFL